MTTSSLLTLDNARMRFGIVLAQSQPSVKVVQITDRDRARAREAVRDKEERLIVRTDTVYVEKRDSVYVEETLSLGKLGTGLAQGDKASPAWVKGLKWIFFIIVGLVALIITAKLCLHR